MANYFVEGLQGSGKSTLAGKLAEKYPDHRALAEGDYSPVELSWCAYMRRAEYEKALEAFPALGAEIRQNSHPEADRVVVCYTKIRTDCQDFYKAMEEYEIYNNRVPLEDFKRIVLTRYRQWREDGLIVECSLFQNIVEELILFRCLEDAQILAFYRQIRLVCISERRRTILEKTWRRPGGNGRMTRAGRYGLPCCATTSTAVPTRSKTACGARRA